MSTNYYIVSKSKLEEFIQLKIETKKIVDKIEDIQKEFSNLLFKYNQEAYTDQKFTSLLNLEDKISCQLEKKHIGKYSNGWRFAFASSNFHGCKDFQDKYNPETDIILDEYDRVISLNNLIKVIEFSLRHPMRNHAATEITEVQLTNCDFYNAEGFRLVSGEFC